MSLSIGIVGLPNVGKSTLFNALTKKSVLAANYPFATIDPSVGVVAVPDARVDQLSEFSQSAKKVPAIVEFVDIAGLVRGAAHGEGLGNAFLSHIRQVDAIAQVVRLFDDSTILHVEGEVKPLRDIETINLELILADLQTIEKRLDSLERDLKRGAKEAELEHAAAVKAQVLLKEGISAREGTYTTDELKAIKGLHLLSMKPVLYVLNKQAGGHNIDELNDERWQDLEEFFTESKSAYVTVDANIEDELRDLHAEDKQSFRQEYGVLDGGLDGLIQGGYDLLGLVSFFTTGTDETRAWTLKRGSTAPEAGGVIHSDFATKFIRAEVIEWEKLLEAGSYAAARSQGFVRTEGKEYTVKDGDVIEFLHG
jgi:ribosome-binding ATPase